MTPLQAKTHYPAQVWAGVAKLLRSRAVKAYCQSCGRYVSELMTWQCGYCDDITAHAHLCDRSGRPDVAAIVRYSIFGRCRNCGREPPGVICPSCGKVNRLLVKADENDVHSHCAGPPKATEKEAGQARLEAVAADHEGQLAAYERDIAMANKQVEHHGAVTRRNEIMKPVPAQPSEEQVREQRLLKAAGVELTATKAELQADLRTLDRLIAEHEARDERVPVERLKRLREQVKDRLAHP